jgi:hypothetical protein
MADPATLYRDFANIADVLQQTLPTGYGLEYPSRFHHTVTSWAVAAKPDDVWWEYFLVEVDSSLYTGVGGSMKVNGYNLKITLVDGNDAPLAGLELVDASPDSTTGSTTYTTSLNQTISSSVGIFGESPTASLGFSTSVGHSVTRSIPDIGVSNTCYNDGQDGDWNLSVAEGASAQGNNLAFTAQMLFRIPSPPAETQVRAKLVLVTVIEDHDNNGSGYYDRTMAAVGPGLQAQSTTVNQFGSRGCYLTLAPEIIKLRRPKYPVAGIAPAQQVANAA